MNKTNTWLIRVFAVVLICVFLIAYLNSQKKTSLLRSKPSIENLEYKAFLLRPKPSIEDLEYKALDKKRSNAEFAANRDYTCLLYTSPSPRDSDTSRMPSSA